VDVLPIFARATARPCLVVGGGAVAAGKAAVLLKAGAHVTVVAPQLDEVLAEHHTNGAINWIDGEYVPSQLDGKWLVIAATNDAVLNAQIVKLAETKGILVNAASDGSIGSFIMPAIIDRSPVIAAVSTGGASPVLARILRARLESLIPPAFGQLAALSKDFRAEVKRRFSRSSERRAFWDRMFSGPVAELVFNGNVDGARSALTRALEEPEHHLGEVYLVGAGPGDPELLTFRALRLIQQADVVVYDRLVSPAVLELVRRDAQRIYAGKRRADHAIEQSDINRLLVDLAKDGKRVARLKGGDPFIFGRGGEEIAELAAQEIPFQVVPAVTAASGCAAYAGIPLTHRDYAHACVFVTGNLANGEVDLDWAALSRPFQTVVVYMGLVGLPIICKSLIAHGLPADTPAAMVEQGTLPNQRVLEGTVATLPDLVERESPKPPTLVIIGEVVRLRASLSWFQGAAGVKQKL
jgi:uroporphyrin-III C-methyltransferase / precorrin-2 dehydrogenase / sirohydrochlorin ferrochelatase